MFLKNSFLIVFSLVLGALAQAQNDGMQAIEYRCSNGQNYRAVASDVPIQLAGGENIFQFYLFCNDSHIPDPNNLTPQVFGNCSGDEDRETYSCYDEFKRKGNSITLGDDQHVVLARDLIEHGREADAEEEAAIDPIVQKVFDTYGDQIQANCLEPGKQFVDVPRHATRLTVGYFSELFAIANRVTRNGHPFDRTACKQMIVEQTAAIRAGEASGAPASGSPVISTGDGDQES